MGYKTELAKFFRGKWLTGPMLSDSAGIVGTQLANATITAANIAPGTVVATDIAAGTITNDKLAANAVTESVTTANTFTTASISATAGITGGASGQIASNTIVDANINSAAAIAVTKLGAGMKKVSSGTIGHADTTKTVISMPANALVTDVIAICTETWNGASASLNLGISGTLEGFIPIASMGLTATNVTGTTLSTRGTLLWQPLVLTFAASGSVDTITTQGCPLQYYTGASPVNLVGTVGGSAGATGATTVYCVYVALA